MAPGWSQSFNLKSVLPIDLSLPKPYVFVDTIFNADHWTRVFKIDGTIYVTRLTQQEPLTRNLNLVIEAEKKPNQSIIDNLIDRVRYECDLDSTLNTIKQERKKDILIDIAVKNNPGFRLYASSNTLETAVLAMIFQNADFVEFQHQKEEFLLTYGNPVSWDNDLRVFPSKQTIANISEEAWKDMGMGFKSTYLAGLTEKKLEKFENYAYYPIYNRGIEGMTKIDGIGDYTARLIMIYAARRYDRAFIDGYVKEVINHKYNFTTQVPLTEFDRWVAERWPKNPALILQAHIQDFFPEHMRSLDILKIRQKYN